MAKREFSLFESLRIEGGLFPGSMLEAIRNGTAKFLAESNYGIPKGLRLRDEIGRAFRIALPLFQEFSALCRRGDRTESDQIANWHEPLFRTILGFSDLESIPVRNIGEREFPIGREAIHGSLPILFIAADTEFDKSEPRFGFEGRRRSPSGLVQEYLNANDETLYGFVCNGKTLRLYRDNHSLTRPAFLEVDLERMFSEELYADFALMYQLLHATRFAPGENGLDSAIIEQWRQESHESGERAVENLRNGVTAAIEELANGFIAHSDNSAMRQKIESGELDIKKGLQLQLLRLVYRIIFLSTAEDRGLLLDPEAPDEIAQRYAAGYSIAILREKARSRQRLDRYTDCWQQLAIVFRGVARGQVELGLPALGGLFDSDQCPDLDSAVIDNRSLLTALHHLSFFKINNTLARINYRDMDSEELGSVYESLLELVPQINFETRPWSFSFAGIGGESRGNARKLSGSYYTPDSLVQELIKSALEPVMKKAIDEHPSNPKEALLSLSVIDPACGSGHFLLAAARRIAGELARLEAAPDQPTEKQYRHALRQVIGRCIYGVDLNPMAVELTHMALWLEALEPGKPLSFLDAHIRCGNALVGVLDPAVVQRGIPDDAFKVLTGDDKSVCATLKKKNKQYRQLLEEKTVATSLFHAAPDETLPQSHLDQMPEETLADIEAKKKAWAEFLQNETRKRVAQKENLYTAAFFVSKTKDTLAAVPTSEDIHTMIAGAQVSRDTVETASTAAEKFHFFHWKLEFPEVFAKGGFDCVLGNPPWERIKLQEEEFFASRSPLIAAATNKAERAKRIAWLSEGVLAKNLYPEQNQLSPVSVAEQKVYGEFCDARREAEAASRFAHIGKNSGGRFPHTGVGDVNLYALFSELVSQIISDKGRSGIIVPSGIATDDSTKAFFAAISQNNQLVSLIDFENREALFKGVHRSYKFCCLTLGRSAETAFSFFLTNTAQLHDARRRFTLTGSDIALLNPNTKTCPVFRSQFDAELTKKIYRAAPAFSILEGKCARNEWGENLSRIFDMGKENDQLLALESQDLPDAYPMYESKYFSIYDHRFACYDKYSEGEVCLLEKKNPEFSIVTEYVMAKDETERRLFARKENSKYLLAYRNITNATNERTVLATILPRCATNYSVRLCVITKKAPKQCMLANINSLILDYVARQKLGGTNLSDYVFRQLPIFPPSKYTDSDLSFITPRVLELTYTAHDLAPFARDLGYDGPPFTFDPDRRALLRAELDAYYAKLYGLTRDELRYILDPADLLGPDYPSETFRVLKDKEMREFGEYRTGRLVLEAWDRLERGELK